jgi:hypothetical protein
VVTIHWNISCSKTGSPALSMEQNKHASET